MTAVEKSIIILVLIGASCLVISTGLICHYLITRTAQWIRNNRHINQLTHQLTHRKLIDPLCQICRIEEFGPPNTEWPDNWHWYEPNR